MSSKRSRPISGKRELENQPSNNNNIRPKKKLKLRFSGKNPYGKIVDPLTWPSKNELREVLKSGPNKIKKWQNSQLSELVVPHLNSKQICTMIDRLQVDPSSLFAKIQFKLFQEMLDDKFEFCDDYNHKLITILKQSLRFICIPEFYEINVCMLSKIDTIPNHVITLLTHPSHRDLLQNMPIKIKREIWIKKLNLFDQEFDNILFNEYCNEFKQTNPKTQQRSNKKSLSKIVDCIAESSVLFARCLHNIEKHYLKKCDGIQTFEKEIICNFRLDLTMSLYEHAHEELVHNNDAIFGFIKMLDNAVIANENDAILDKNKIECLYKIFSSKKTDCSMILFIPKVRRLLLKSYIYLLLDIANSENSILPRNCKAVSLLTQMIIGNNNNNNKSKNNAKANGDSMNHSVIFEFAPLLTISIYFDSNMMVSPAESNLGDLTEECIYCCLKNQVCMHLLLYFIIYSLTNGNIGRVIQIINLCYDMDITLNISLLNGNGMFEIEKICELVLGLQTDNNENKIKCIQFILDLLMMIDQNKNIAHLRSIIENLISNTGLSNSEQKGLIEKLKSL